MDIEVELDDDLLAAAGLVTGVQDPSGIVTAALRHVVAAAKRPAETPLPPDELPAEPLPGTRSVDLFAERVRLAKLAESGELPTAALSREVRIKIARAWENAVEDVTPTDPYEPSAFQQVQEHLEFSLGLRLDVDPITHFEREPDFAVCLSILEALDDALSSPSLLEGDAAQQFFRSEINRIFRAHNIAFRTINGQFIPVSSFELTAHVVEPALLLLHDARFANVEEAYAKALEEIRRGDPADAITDAGTALSEMFVAAGIERRPLGDQIKQASTNGLLGNAGEAMSRQVSKLATAVADIRNNGEAHKSVERTEADAWFVVHLAGILIVRIASHLDFS